MLRRGSFSRFLVPGTLFVLILVLYAPSARHHFIYDDFTLIVGADRPRTAGEIVAVFTERHWPELPYYRPIARLSIRLQHYLHDREPAPFHLFNATLMALIAVLAYALLRQPSFGNVKV